MNRKDWLETFLWLADNNRPAIEYRKRLRIMLPQLSKLVKQIPKLRTELAELIALERAEKEELERVERDKRRRRKEIKRRAEERALAAARETSDAKPTDRTGGSDGLESRLQESSSESSVERTTSEHDEGANAESD